MAYGNNRNSSNRQQGNSAPRDFAPPLPADTSYPERAKEMGISQEEWITLANAYRGAAIESIIAVWASCKARGLDPTKKPLHIVPMYNKALKAMVDTIYPGIYELRAVAEGTNLHAGTTEPEFGPMMDFPVNLNDPGGATLRAPEFCRVTVKRVVPGTKTFADFPHIVFFGEAVARTSGGVINEMWMKRPRGMLDKCTEAGALRKGFPGQLGGIHAAEEMFGRDVEDVQNANVVGEHGASGVPGPVEVQPAQQEDVEVQAVIGAPAATVGAMLDRIEQERAASRPVSPVGNPPPSHADGGALAEAAQQMHDAAMAGDEPTYATKEEAQAAAARAKTGGPVDEATPDPKPAQQASQAPAAKEASTPPTGPASSPAAPAAPGGAPPSPLKIDLGSGPLSMLHTQMRRFGCVLPGTTDPDTVSLLNRMGKDIVMSTINEAFAILKNWKS